MKTISKLWLLALAFSVGSMGTALAEFDSAKLPQKWKPTRGNTAGYSMMTKQERMTHRDKMRAFKSYDECKAYIDDHHKMMEARAKEKGKPMPMMKKDPCAHLAAAK